MTTSKRRYKRSSGKKSKRDATPGASTKDNTQRPRKLKVITHKIFTLNRNRLVAGKSYSFCTLLIRHFSGVGYIFRLTNF